MGAMERWNCYELYIAIYAHHPRLLFIRSKSTESIIYYKENILYRSPEKTKLMVETDEYE